MKEEMNKRRLLIGCRTGVKERLKAVLPHGFMSVVLAELFKIKLPEIMEFKVSDLSKADLEWDDRVYVTVDEDTYNKIKDAIPHGLQTAVLSTIVEQNLDSIEAMKLVNLRGGGEGEARGPTP